MFIATQAALKPYECGRPHHHDPAGDWSAPQKAATALDRYGHADEAAALVAFVAGPESSYITAANFTADGGHNGELVGQRGGVCQGWGTRTGSLWPVRAGAKGGRANAISADLGIPDGAALLAKQVRSIAGDRLDVLVLNGPFFLGQQRSPF